MTHGLFLFNKHKIRGMKCCGMNGKCGVKKIRERMLLHTYISLSFPCVLFNCNEIKRAFPYLYFISIKHYTQGLGVHHQTRFFLLSSYTPSPSPTNQGTPTSFSFTY